MSYFGFPIINKFRSHTPKGFYHPTKGHTGVDYATPEGTPLKLHFETTVLQILQQGQMGLTLYLKDKKGKILVFSHLKSVKVAVGDAVAPNFAFALSGNTGSATTGPHLHFEVIAASPQQGLEFMTRSLGGFSGYNHDPVAYLDGQEGLPPEEHWSDDAMAWALEHEIITEEHDPNERVKWGEFVVVCKRLAERILDWTDDKT